VAHTAKPPSVVAAPRLCRSCTFPLGPARVPRRKTVKIESTVSSGAKVTSSALGRMSTWQLGVKHSITKRCTRGPCREVRLVSVANPHRVRAPSRGLSVQVERGLGGRSSKGCAGGRSWLKRSGGVRVNRSVNRLLSFAVTAAPVRPLGPLLPCKPFMMCESAKSWTPRAARGDRAGRRRERHRAGCPGWACPGPGRLRRTCPDPVRLGRREATPGCSDAAVLGLGDRCPGGPGPM
jgi:hypothetical protein